MRSARAWVLAWHKVLGLGLGGVLALLGLTGGALVFYLEIDRALNPPLRVSVESEARPAMSPQAVLQVLRARYPELKGAWRIEFPLSASTPWMARYYRPPERLDRSFAPLMVTVDPLTLKISSSRYWGDTVMTWIYDLHYQLLWDRTGRVVVGWLGWALLFLLVAGLTLWWPSRQRFRSAIQPVLRTGQVRRTYDLHVLTGVYTSLAMGLVALTGVGLAWPDATRTAFSVWAPVRAQSAPLPQPAAVGKPVLGLDAALRFAQLQFADAEPRWIESSGARGEPISVRLYQHFEPGRRFPQTQVWLHPATGEVLALRDPRDNSAAEGVLAWLHALHNGEALGLGGRLLYVLLGLVPAIACVTGALRWWHKRNAHRRARARLHSSGAGS